MKCRRIFQSLSTLAIPELVQVADALLAPVRLGICLPAQPFSLLSSTLDATQASEDLFTVEPLSMQRPSTPSSVEEVSTQELRPTVQRVRNPRHSRRRPAVTIPRATQEQSGGPVEGAPVEGEEVEVFITVGSHFLSAEKVTKLTWNRTTGPYFKTFTTSTLHI